MKLGKEYNDLATVLRFDSKENVRFEKADEGLTVGEGSICIKGDFSFDELGQTASVFGVKEDNSVLIETMDKLDESNFGILFKGSPRIVHQSDVQIDTVIEEVDTKEVYSTKARLGAGYTAEGSVIIATLESATVKQLAQVMKQLGCAEAINVYGKEVGIIEYKGIQSEPEEKQVQEKKPTAPRKRRTKKQS